ncbi:MAG: hypothetical protein NTW22_00010 [Proteobacteria bacterium]|nr:hypothetical protein [Pseudomonadota bacterium]
MPPLKTAEFQRKLNRINHHLILTTPFPEINLSKIDPILRGDDRVELTPKTPLASFPHRQESLKKIINSGKLKIPPPPWLNDP